MLCWTRGYSDGGAIPFRFFLNPYRVISDSYGVFVYDPDAGFARGFCPVLRIPLPRLAQRRHGHEAQGRHALFVPDRCRLRRAEEGHAAASRCRPCVSDWGCWLEQYPERRRLPHVRKVQPVDLPAAAKNPIR